MMKMKMVATTMKKRRPFFSPAISSTWPTRKPMTASTKFCTPDGMSFMERVAMREMMMRNAITTQEVMQRVGDVERADLVIVLRRGR